MVKLEWKFNGRTVTANRVVDELAKAVRAQATEAAKARIARVRCPVHGTAPANIRVSSAGNRLEFQYKSCCDCLQQAVNASFK